jgi:5-methylthioribose kinase
VIELSAANTAAWLARNGVAVKHAACSELGGGISNKVILVEGSDFRAVVKQSLGRLRVEQEWLSNRNRILREAAAMRWLSPRMRSGRVPSVLLEDEAEFAIVIEAAPPAAEMWKTRLLRGDIKPETAHAAGALLASVIAAGWDNPEARRLFHDQTVFEELRIDPYYRFTAARHPEIAGYFDDLIVRSAARRASLVHGDFSPKNLLTDGSDIWAIDWEAVHFGDPSFDVAFIWNHLLMKSIAMPQHAAALAGLVRVLTDAVVAGLPAGAHWVCEAALEHLPALLLARVDGKSPAEYLDSGMRGRARALALSLIANPPTSVKEIFER